MTLVDDMTTTPHAKESRGEAPRRPRAVIADVRRRVIVLSALVLAAAVAVVLVFGLFEGSVEQVWYTARQHARAADFNGAHEHSSPGRAIAVLQVPRLRLNLMVAEGDSPEQLRGGPGHRRGTPIPGAIGNSVILGHQHSWGGPFAALAKMHRGDLIAVQVHEADGTMPVGVFTVDSVRPAGPHDAWPFASSNDHRITLITGRGDRFGNGRLVVTAVSGRVGKSTAAGSTASKLSSGSLGSGGSQLAAFGVIGALVAWLALRRRYGALAVAVVVVPLAVVGVLGVLLSADLLLPVLR